MDEAGPTVVLGFDALSLEYLDEFDLPNFDSLRERGVTAPLESTFPPWTGSAWPSMYTGVDPSHHGVYSFFDFDDGYPDQTRLVSRNDVHAPALWNYLSALGTTSVVLNVPVTHPAEQIEGALVPGYLAPEDAAGYPSGIRDDLTAALGTDYRIYATHETGEGDEAMLQSYVDLIDLRARAAETLLAEYDPEVAILQVQKTDTVFHQFDTRDAFQRVYEAADAFLETVLSAIPSNANVVICSDHGIGPTRGYNIYVNEILRNEGFVEATTEGQTPSLGATKAQLASETETSSDSSPLSNRAVRGLLTALSRLNIHPGDVYAVARTAGIDDTLRRLLPDDIAGSIQRHVDWSASRAYCRSGPELGIRINLEGREPEGVVPQAEYEAVRDAVIETLTSVRTPDGEPGFEWVKRREAVYDGPYASSACDVVFQPTGMNHIVATNLLGRQFVSIDKYNHKNDGVFVGAGPAFAAQGTVDSLSLIDVAPIVMTLAGAPVPERMTGTVNPSLLRVTPERQAYEDVSYGGGSIETVDDQAETRLRDLGYL